MMKLGFVAIAVAAAAALAACGGGGGSSPAPAATTAAPATTPTPTPTPAPPAPGPVTLAYTTTFGVNAAASGAPPALAFLAPTQTATLTAAEANYAGSFTAVSSCTNITVAPASSATGTFTLTGAVPTGASPCTITITGATGNAVGLTSSVPTPAGVVLRWYTPQATSQAVPVPFTAGPINIVGLGLNFAPILAISEQNYIGGFAAANVVTSAPCAGAATIAVKAAPTGLPTAAPGASLVYYTVTGAAGIATAANCTITATDSYVPVAPATANPSVSIGVSVTSTTGTFQ